MVRTLALLILVGQTSVSLGGEPRPDAETFFELKVRPLFHHSCYRCHGGKKVSGRLRIDSRTALLKGGESGPALVPGDPEKSLLLQAVRHSHDNLHMPPDKRLPDAAIADLATWIKQGAVWPPSSKVGGPVPAPEQHWAFQSVRAALPPADPTGWAEQPIDRFVAAKLREHGLKPVGSADKRTLIRRAAFDLIGLPPSPQDVEQFLADDSPQAFRQVVERLLASPHYGERWGRHWMDVARYADTAGDNADYPIPEIHLYRDYVIDSFNQDKPYDAFVREQLAGDILARKGPREAFAERTIATGFLALSRRYATAPYELWHLTLDDAIATTGAAFLGLTLGCARCHDHKFDPVTTQDYYALYGIFASTTFPYTGSEEYSSKHTPRMNLAPLLPPEEMRTLDKTPPANVPAAYAVTEGKPVSARLHVKGDPDVPGPLVPRGVPKFLDGGRPFPVSDNGSGRLQLAEWLTRPDHPLTARVMVNRIWQHHFGRGLVGTPSNFGLRGEPPTHPELLDYLAQEFVRSGWSVKHMHRLILLSRTYQLSGAYDAANAVKDPGNRWYWRHERRRLDAEAIRDALLLVAGDLDLRRPGRHPFPAPPQWRWTQHNPFKEVYPSRHRSVYLMTQRLQRHPFLALFDGPDTNESTATRSSSTVPLQALFWMNNPFARERADGLARRLLATSNDPARRVELACAWAWCRRPSAAEVQKAVAYVRRYEEELARSGVPAEQRAREAWASYGRVILTANEFVYLD
jgi:cytochrome c553